MTSDIVKSYTLTRNVLGDTIARSAERVSKYINLIGDGLLGDDYRNLSKVQKNDISALASNTGLFVQADEGGYLPTELNRNYRILQAQNPNDSWQWLLTRTLWHQQVPNGSNGRYNAPAKAAGVEFNLFKSIVTVTQILAGMSNDERFLYYSELLFILKNDENWALEPLSFLAQLMHLRKAGLVDRNRALLEDLEDEYGAGRDNLNTVFVKAYRQTGLFSFKVLGGANVGIALAADLTPVLQRRVRHVIDTDLSGDPINEWTKFIGHHANDIPLEVDLVDQHDEVEEDTVAAEVIEQRDIADLVSDFHEHLAAAGLRFSRQFVARFVAAVLTKPFVILSGLSGSGKTKLAEAFAIWLTGLYVNNDALSAGTEVRATTAKYRVVHSDSHAVTLRSEDDAGGEKLTTLPRGLIDDWVSVILRESLTRETKARDIRELVGPETSYDLHLNGLESHLKAVAFAVVENKARLVPQNRFCVVPVGADWTSSDRVLGYPDALDVQAYVKTPSLNVLLGAHLNAKNVHLLIMDEMNLSHVERYFAELLSAIETRSTINLYDPVSGPRGDVPHSISKYPPNFVVIGTINVDETTYMFSPKVLDRSNVLEFRMNAEDLRDYLKVPAKPDFTKLTGLGEGFAFLFDGCFEAPKLDAGMIADLTEELAIVFEIMQTYGSEFGYRVASEITNYIEIYLALQPQNANAFDEALDAQLVQKILPKLHGGERELRPILWAFAALAVGSDVTLAKSSGLEHTRSRVRAALLSEGGDPTSEAVGPARFPLTLEKVTRMLRRLRQNGYVSFAEN
ncbi:hypothetical protein [Agrobacterium larrymoorei]|uniref:DUF3578 domain-containing protein n=1 Tax=Agrobacterium larrymoorei TaxID=160699 RepID=A0A4D7DXC5_9HYPH|nr:hypothetical protein [Agrobacterium larrymoorei]QCI98846.1 hypothetical protein CFBP5473_13640 [Agrobacterium larrymoorei]QYA08266.1 hypothetical protein J5285_06095 [Agrobacterium larrymoorei]